MSMVEDEARTKADAARVTREALHLVAQEAIEKRDYPLFEALRTVENSSDDVMLRIRGLIR